MIASDSFGEGELTESSLRRPVYSSKSLRSSSNSVSMSLVSVMAMETLDALAKTVGSEFFCSISEPRRLVLMDANACGRCQLAGTDMFEAHWVVSTIVSVWGAMWSSLMQVRKRKATQCTTQMRTDKDRY